MNPIFKGALMVVSLGLLVLSPYSVAVAASGQVTVETLRGPLVNAWFSTTHGCVQTDTFVHRSSPRSGSSSTDSR